jgi:3-isopropylmalate dehydratase small subunit
MGAASALKYGKAEVIVADSSFKCLKSLCKQVAKNHSPIFVPNCMINCLFPCVFFKLKKDVMKKANYNVE